MKLQSLSAMLALGLLAYSCGSQPKKVIKPTPKNNTETNISKKNTTPPIETKKEETLKVNLPKINREFRAAWVASVANINWPSKNNLTTEQQKSEAVQLLDFIKNNNLNAVILQVRPSADALYKSNIEPWSYFLTGEVGKAPNPYYDPLEFWIEEAHKRGIELHIWLNPYRAHHSNGGKVSSKSIVNNTDANIIKLKNGMYWFDPSDKKTQDHTTRIVMDLVKRYDIDGVHFDDYFYPYATYNNGADFPDSKTWNEYQRNGGTLSRADWRRDNVNKFVERIYKEIKAEKNYVKFGISPFGIWKPGYPAGITGSSQYDELYADAKLWLNKGWIDYYAPQLYWNIDSKGQSFPKLLTWWKQENTQNRHLWPGINTVEVRTSLPRHTEIVNQVKMSREILQNNTGVIHWSIAGITKNPEMKEALIKNVYAEKALVPKTPWLKIEKSDKPSISYTEYGGNINAIWKSTSSEKVFQWVLFLKYGDTWETLILDKNTQAYTTPKQKNGKTLNTIAIQSIDRLSNESDYDAKKIK